MLFNTEADCTHICLCRMAFSLCYMTVQNKLSHVTLCKYYSTVVFDIYCIMITYSRSLRGIWKQNVSLCQSIDIIISTAMCQHCDTAHCNTIWKSDDSHKVSLIESSALPDIPPLTACHSTQSALQNSYKYRKTCYSRLILHLGARKLMVISFTQRPLFLQDALNRSLCGLLFRSSS